MAEAIKVLRVRGAPLLVQQQALACVGGLITQTQKLKKNFFQNWKLQVQLSSGNGPRLLTCFGA